MTPGFRDRSEGGAGQSGSRHFVLQLAGSTNSG
jgi:hypothetical protein